MSNETFIDLKARRVKYYSANDEAAFFEWLSRINCVVKVDGKGRDLYLKIQESRVDDDQLREILAIFYRYKIDMKQLLVFDRPEFSDWFRGRKKYWHVRVFGQIL